MKKSIFDFGRSKSKSRSKFSPERSSLQIDLNQEVQEDVAVSAALEFVNLGASSSHVPSNYDEDDRWETRWDALVPVGVEASPAYSMDAEYLDWHTRRTHSYLLQNSAAEMQVNANRGPQSEVDDHVILQTARSMVAVLRDYRDVEGRLGDARLEDAIRGLIDLFFGPTPPPPILLSRY
ncbi:hypothetical protein V2J09_011563 [Rumex salicifolius]